MKKHYIVSVKSAEDWGVIHELLTQDGTLEDNIPTRACECTNLTEHSSVRSTYLLDEEEIALLTNNARVTSVELDPNFHSEEWRSINPLPSLRDNRWGKNVKHYRSLSTTVPWATKAIAQAESDWDSQEDRTGYQILRLTQKDDPWKSSTDYYTETGSQEGWDQIADVSGDTRYHTPRDTIFSDAQYNYDGTGVDVVITDDACWAGHPEFVNDSGVSQIYDVLFDAPYFIDPEYFDTNNLTTQFLGKTVPTEAAAKNWWSDASARSPIFQTGGEKYFGTINANGLTWYTRERFLGSFDAYPTEFTTNLSNHGTNCASQAYGKNFGWAFNANKWFISYYLAYTTQFDLIKIFHYYKKDNIVTNDKNPLVISASWGPYGEVETEGFFKYRTDSIQAYTSANIPNHLKHFNNSVWYGPPPFLQYPADETSSSSKLALEELVALDRLYFFYASGNTNSITVKPSDPDYDNFWNTISATPTNNSYYVNRVGFPGNAGWDENLDEYACFSIGALDDRVVLKDGVKKEAKAVYSCMGTGIDIYSPGEKTLGASMNSTHPSFTYTVYERFDGVPGDGNSYANLGIKAYDSNFNGTSAATPIAAGFFAAFLQNRRNWNWVKLKKFIKNTLESQSSNAFHIGATASSANDSSWDDNFSLQGSSPKIPYLLEAPTISISSQPSSQTTTEGNSVTFSVNAVETATTGALSYQWQKSLDSGSTWIDISGATSSSYSFTTSNSDNNSRYRAIISGTFGVDDTATNAVTLSIQTSTPNPDPDPSPNPDPTPPPPTGIKNYLNAIDWTVLMGIKPKQYLYNRFGSEIYNKKEIFPKSFSIFSQEDCEIKIIRQKACPEFAYMHQEGYRWALLPEERRIKAKFSVNNFNINESALGITSADATSHTATLAYAGAAEGNWRSPTSSANYSVANNEELRVVGDDLFQLAITQKNLSGVNSVFKLNRVIGGGYLSSRDPDIETENVYLPFTYAPVGEYSTGYEVEFDYYRRDQTLISSVNIISDEFFIFWTGGGRGGIDSSHRSTVRIGFAWPNVSNSSSLIHVSRGADKWGVETPDDVGGEFVPYDGQNFYEGVPVDFVHDYSENSLYIETNTELNINTYNLEVSEYDDFDEFWDLGEISVPGAEGGECHGLGCKAGRELREAEIVVYEEDQGDGNFADIYYLQDLSPWPSLGEPYFVTITQGANTVTAQVSNPTSKVVGDAVVYLLPLGTSLPIGLTIGDAEVSYNIIYIATIDKQSRVRSILTSKIAPGDLPYVKVFMQGRQGASMGGMWIGQKTPNGIILDPFTPHRSTVNIKDSGSESHGESFPAPDTKTDGAIKVINTFTQIDNFGRSTAPTFDNSIDSLNTYKSIHTNPRKCGSFLSAGGTNAAGILTPTDYPIRWLTDKNSGLPLATFYVSKNESVEISLEEIFNVDAESVVNSDDANLATIFIARSLNNHTPAGSRKEIYMTLNYDEQ